MRQPHLAGFRNFHPHALRHSFAGHSAKRGRRYGYRRCSTIQSAVITQRYLHGLDGQMAACFERLKLAQHLNNRGNGPDFSQFRACPFYNASVLTERLRFISPEDSSDERRPPPSTTLTSWKKTRFMDLSGFAISCNIFQYNYITK